MNDLHELLENVERSVQSCFVQRFGTVFLAVIFGFNHLQIPATELVCEQFEYCHEGLVKPILAVQVVDFCYVGAYPGLHPRDGVAVER